MDSYHIYSVILSRSMSDYRRGSGVMIGFIGLSDTASDYDTLSLSHTHTYTPVSTVTFH
jgi:hypothetical protein